MRFEPVGTEDQIKQLAAMADEIWHEYWPALIGEDQTDYMVEQFQSVPAIRRQLDAEGYVYYLMQCGGEAAGFVGLVPHKEGKMFLSKLYVSKAHRGEGLPRAAFDFVAERCRAEGLDRIYLTVNKRNTHAIEVYRHFGFYEIDAVVTDIGCGYVMDDYILQKEI